MVFQRNIDSDQITPQLVPSGEFTTCDYSNFPENFDLSLLPGGDIPLSPLTIFQNQPSENVQIKRENEVKMYPIFHVEEDQSESFKYSPDFQKLLESDSDTSPGSNLGQSPFLNIHLEIPLNNFHPNSPNSTRSLSPYSPKSLSSPSDQFNVYRQSGELSFYPSSPEQSFYSPSPVFSQSPRDDYSCHFNNDNISTSPIPTFSNFGMKEENFFTSFDISAPNSPTNSYQSSSKLNSSISGVTNMAENSLIREQMKEEETTIDFSTLLNFHENNTLKDFLDNTFNSECKSDNTNKKPEDHQLLRKALKDTSFQKKYNINSNNLLDFDNIRTYIKMEENEELKSEGIDEQMARTNIEPVLDLAIEQVKKEVNETCVTLGISSDPFHWSPDNVFSWVQWTSRKFNIPEPLSNNWNINGADLLELSEEDFLKRCNQGGMILHAQLEIWKASYSNDGSEMQWFPETASSNASSGDLSEDEDDIPSIQSDSNKPTTTRSSSHIHLWQFLKELLQNSQINGSCIRWLDRSKGIFKIEDSVKVAKLWGKRKNRPAMNYDKLSRSIRQYYKKGIMKKTERSQRLVYQFCSPYNS